MIRSMSAATVSCPSYPTTPTPFRKRFPAPILRTWWPPRRAQASDLDAARTVPGWWPQESDTAGVELPSSFGLLHLAGPPTGLEGKPAAISPTDCVSLRSSPNPFAHRANISFRTSSPGVVSLKVYNLAGQDVKRIFRRYLERGVHAVQWDAVNEKGRPAAPGLYFCRLEGGGNNSSIRLFIIR